MNDTTRRDFLSLTAKTFCAAGAGLVWPVFGQSPGERPNRAPGVTVLNPRERVPVGLIIDDSTCLVNLNRFAMPQFDRAFAGENKAYKKNWQDWPAEIPDAFVRKFGEWCSENGVKGKYSVVPYPACVGRIDRLLPGWTDRALRESIELVKTVITPNWDIHPEMVTHTRVIDTKTGHPYPDHSIKFMENWEWTTGRSADELTDYLSYALRILKNIEMPCEGITTPGGFGVRARPQLAQATLNSVREVYGAEIPHYFRDLYDRGQESVSPRVEYASGLESDDPRCVVSIVGCTGDWTGGWDCSTPEGPDRFITPDLKQGRMIEVIERGEPAFMVCHWTGIYWNGQELGFKVFQEVVRRLHARFDHLLWMKLSEASRYWAAKELTRIQATTDKIQFRAPFACPDFTIRVGAKSNLVPRRTDGAALKEVSNKLHLAGNSWRRDGDALVICFSLPRGSSELLLKSS